ncbi:hypothetical protein BK709_15585 [Bacillus thuringiensis serovar shandongiensis]|nr:hypothetical protein BK709_15585 [Bacillus thuringiensis serovar shandongiensis]
MECFVVRLGFFRKNQTILFCFCSLFQPFWLHFLPLFKTSWEPIFSFIGFEISFFLYLFLQKKQYATQGIIIANTLTFLFYLFTIVICFLYFSPDAITEFNQPVLNLLKVIEFSFLERFDMILLAIYLIVVSTTWIPYVYVAVFCSSQLIGKPNHTLHVAIFLSFSDRRLLPQKCEGLKRQF